MNRLLGHRMIAFGMDYLVIIAYAAVLYFLSNLFHWPDLSLAQSQLLGFFTLTVPVFFYFYLMEKSNFKASLGKRLMKLRVEVNSGNARRSLIIRNALKLLPWEMAHTGVHYIRQCAEMDLKPPLWVWLALIIPQVIVLIYLATIIYFKGKKSLYDHLANTQVVFTPCAQ